MFVLVSALADELGMDKSNMRKYILQHGIEPVKVRTPESRGQCVLAVTPDEAESIRQQRQEDGYGTFYQEAKTNGLGHFYIVQVIPELDPRRIKLGYANDAIARLQAHRTAAPTAELVKYWPCRRSWESAAIASMTRKDCVLIANEVFECSSLASLVESAEAFFSMMPNS